MSGKCPIEEEDEVPITSITAELCLALWQSDASRKMLSSGLRLPRVAASIRSTVSSRQLLPSARTASRIVPALQTRPFSSSPRRSEIAKTGLYDFHVRNGGKMVNFGGYKMPLTYGDVGQVASHNHVRNACGLFDVGHMVQHTFEGQGSLAFLESLVPTSLQLKPWSSTLSVLLNEQGGIIDDLIICKQQDDQHWYVVTNAGRRKEDLAHIEGKLQAWTGDKVEHTILDGHGLVALQGPQADEVLAKHTDADLGKLVFGTSVKAKVAGADCHIARGGYTGEDGFEISIPPKETEKVTQALLDTAPTQLAGLAARDSLRLEAGMCLYGEDLNETVSPVEGGLSWVVSKPRRERADFPGAERILRELKEGPTRRRVGLVVDGAPARKGAPLTVAGDATTIVGQVTSGIPSPTRGEHIAMAYVQNGLHKKGTQLQAMVRNQLREATIVGLPFVPSKFYRG